MLTAEGFQADSRIQCTATPQGQALIIKFYKSASASSDRYRIGAALFTLSRTRSGIVTRLQALSPAIDHSPRSGRLFRRLG